MGNRILFFPLSSWCESPTTSVSNSANRINKASIKYSHPPLQEATKRPRHLLIETFLLTPGLPWSCHRILASAGSSLKPCTFPSRRLFQIGMQAYSCKCFTACLDCHWPGSICNDFVWRRLGSSKLPSDLMLWLFSFFFFFFSCSSKEIWDPGHVKHYFADFKSFCNIAVNLNAKLKPVNSIFNLDFVSAMDTVISKYLRVCGKTSSNQILLRWE